MDHNQSAQTPTLHRICIVKAHDSTSIDYALKLGFLLVGRMAKVLTTRCHCIAAFSNPCLKWLDSSIPVV
eukprot:2964136-Amphidinium_carterae.1